MAYVHNINMSIPEKFLDALIFVIWFEVCELILACAHIGEEITEFIHHVVACRGWQPSTTHESPQYLLHAGDARF